MLTLGPAYGQQLHGELLDRAAHRRAINVGQIYATLDRLLTSGHVERAGETDDGLPLYALTAAGLVEAEGWMAGFDELEADWIEMLDRVLIASSIDGAGVGLIDRYAELWTMSAAGGVQASGSARFADAAATELAGAALRWLDGIRPAAASGDLAHGLREDRPRRGRRPASA
ncbi:PadR family transcriptional regulator [Naasia lichenicola]|uniref:PadR family transcriptional regulator n=1 Tax=Naasia lichenicola TaxID=2565933 RepID=UPI001E2B6A1B|nr:PadR family transcriptional regulator [Naasia lichenicola]